MREIVSVIIKLLSSYISSHHHLDFLLAVCCGITGDVISSTTLIRPSDSYFTNFATPVFL